MLAAAGVTSVRVHARPVVTIFSTGDEVVPPETETLRPGQVRDATAVGAGRAGRRRGRRPGPRRHRPRRPRRPGERAARGAAGQRHDRGLGRLVGRRARRDRRRGGPARPAGHLVPRPGDQAGQAHPAGRVRPGPEPRPGDRAARQPALGARGVPADRDAAGPPGRRLHGAAAGSLDARAAGAEPGVGHRAARRGPGDGCERGRHAAVRPVGAAVRADRRRRVHRDPRGGDRAGRRHGRGRHPRDAAGEALDTGRQS